MLIRKKAPRRLLGVAGVIMIAVLTVVGLGSPAGASTNVVPAHSSLVKSSLIPRGDVYIPHGYPKGAEIVNYGIEPIQAYDISLTNDVWRLNFYLWFRWKSPDGKPADAIDPTSTTAYDNASNAETNFQVSYSYTDAQGHEQPTKLADGSFYQLEYVQCGFADNFDLARYPLDSQQLTIRFENTTYDSNQLDYVPDPAGSTSQKFDVPDWDPKGITYQSYIKHYTTDFGNSDSAGPFQNWSLATYSITIKRPLSNFLAKLLLPLLIVLVASLLVLFLKSEHEISRLALSASGLLTLIFLQQGYSGELPPTVPLVLMDQFYALAYLIILVTFARIIWETTQVFHLKVSADTFIKTDRILAVVLGAAFFGGLALMILL